MTGSKKEDNGDEEQLFESADSAEAKALRQWMFRVTEHLADGIDEGELRRLRELAREATGWEGDWTATDGDEDE